MSLQSPDHRWVAIPATIDAGDEWSGAIDCLGSVMKAFCLPAELDGAELEVLTAPRIDGSFQPVAFSDSADGEVLLAIPVTPGRVIVPIGHDAVALSVVRFIKVGFGVPQSALREFHVLAAE